jgi:hypothetical protein
MSYRRRQSRGGVHHGERHQGGSWEPAELLGALLLGMVRTRLTNLTTVFPRGQSFVE